MKKICSKCGTSIEYIVKSVIYRVEIVVWWIGKGRKIVGYV